MFRVSRFVRRFGYLFETRRLPVLGSRILEVLVGERRVGPSLPRDDGRPPVRRLVDPRWVPSTQGKRNRNPVVETHNPVTYRKVTRTLYRSNKNGVPKPRTTRERDLTRKRSRVHCRRKSKRSGVWFTVEESLREDLVK